jgi:hypothetical protein
MRRIDLGTGPGDQLETRGVTRLIAERQTDEGLAI